MGFDSAKEILRNDDGDVIPQIWNDELQKFIPYEGKIKLESYRIIENGELTFKIGGEIRCLSADIKPDASAVELYQLLIEMDTGVMYYSDGTEWREW